MKLIAKYEFQEEYIPPRCRKSRYREVEKTMSVSVREITSNEAPIAMIVTDYDTRNGEFGVCDTEYRWYKNKLYKLYRHESGNEKGNIYTIEDMTYEVNRAGRGYPANADEKRRISDIRKTAKRFLIIDGDIYVKSGEPRYVIHTFGLGHNHGGSSLSISEYYNGNIGKNNYFNALQRKEAITYFEKVALGRGDTESVHAEYVDNIQVLLSEAVKCNPQKEHGNGDPFINSMESMISGSGSMVEAGLMAICMTKAETDKIKTKG